MKVFISRLFGRGENKPLPEDTVRDLDQAFLNFCQAVYMAGGDVKKIVVEGRRVFDVLRIPEDLESAKSVRYWPCSMAERGEDGVDRVICDFGSIGIEYVKLEAEKP